MATFVFKRGETYWFRATINGRTIRQSLRTSSLQTARKEAAKLLETYRDQAHRGIYKTTWKEAVVAWTDDIEKRVGPKTAERYATSIKQCEAFLKPLLIQQIDGKVIADLIAFRTKSATHATVRRDLTAISSVMDYAIGREWIENNPIVTKRRLLKERREPIVLPERGAIETVIAAAPTRFADFIRAAWLTGCRQDELATAKWSGFKSGTLEVVGKGRKRRVIRLYPEAVALIEKQVRVLGSDLIFCSEDGRQFRDPATMFSHLRRAVIYRAEKEGRTVQRFRFHDLRHLFAVEALRDARMSIYALQKHLGHSSVKVTELYLQFLTPDQQDRASHDTSQEFLIGNQNNGVR